MDESWQWDPARDEQVLAVVSVITTHRRGLLLTTRRLKKMPKLKPKSELKASASSLDMIKKFLHALADDPHVSIVVTIWRGKRQAIQDHEQLYRKLVGRCALQTAKRSKRIDLFIDKRYTHKPQQQELEGAIREALAAVAGNVVRVFQEDSSVVKELAAPDFVAWAVSQRYGRNNREYYNIIRSKIVHFNDLSRKRKSGSP